ncbi:MAG: hypothetical protein CRU78_17105 [Candidatus Accumulibacter phosphatis]|uniref:PD-(D/E)XK endonuclease-like domain-containing protein n=1 Tax=Candidatus Accumulibacter phosphatis TaxID=327160 RepID=A0A6A7RX61_9PROT|nr:hypothetical protein [Candidatus Accumulibacter phosphatis]
MLDFNHKPQFHERVTGVIDQALDAERAQQTPRQYLGASRLGVSCERALQFEYAGAPVDPGRGFSGRTLRIFEVGHVLEDLAVRWLRLAGFELHTRRRDGGQFGFSVAGGRIQGHVDGIISDGPAELGLSYPLLFECKTMNDRNWKACVKSGVAVSKPVYAAQVAIYQAYMEPAIAGISDHPALFTAINKDTQELWFELVPFDGGLAQRMSDRAVRVIQATEPGELLPRITTDSSYYECKYCSWATRCWSAA